MSDLARMMMREAPHDDSLTQKCQCCEPARRCLQFRNGPKTKLAVCPNTRMTFVLFDHHLAIGSGYFTGSLNGV